MSGRDDEDLGRPTEPPGRPTEREPDWADEIQRLRRARGARLREVFSSFDDEQEER